MSLLDVITKAASVNSEVVSTQLEYPIVLNSDDIFLKLKPNPETLNPTSLATPVIGWQLAESDTHLIELGKKFHSKLKRKLKDTNHFNKDEFCEILNSYLKKIGDKVGISTGLSSSDDGYSRALIEKIGFLMGRDVAGLVLDACVSLEAWDLVETLIVKGLVDYSCYSNLVTSLVAKKRSDLLVLSIKHATDLGLSDLLRILKFFLRPSKEAYSTMENVRKEWESQALSAIEMLKNKNISDKKQRIAKEAAILLMLAHDGFSTSELCLHYLLASVNIDEVILSSSIRKLSGEEMMSLIRYLGKWLKKYETFPQAGPCPKASSTLDLKACDWVPKLDDIVKCLGLVLDENFSSLVLHSEFHEEVKVIEKMVSSLALESKFCCSVAYVVENLKTNSLGEQN
ncbi:uncharacterized protein LOC126671014 [Mercurialis annua]|uniref:uncharacterized protein LOC126671014 n=1 Tax=Mercurialis annua TaxID=3986 RepID=UPI00216014A2|nr:uncharacterized protein LOC126671014 [Mercurialis annua]